MLKKGITLSPKTGSISWQILEDAARKSKTHIRIDLKGKPNYKRDLANAIEESFDQIDEDTAKAVTDILLNSVK